MNTTLEDLYMRIEWEDKHKSPARRDLIRSYANEVWEKIWSKKRYSWRRVKGSFQCVADYTTGTISVTTGQRSATISGATLTAAMVFRKIRVASDNREYVLKTINTGTGAVTFDDPYEGDTDTDATFTIIQREQRLPPNFDCFETVKESSGQRPLWYRDRESFERAYTDPNSSGQAGEIAPAGVTSDALYSTGTLATTSQSGDFVGSGTSFLEARDLGRRIVLRGFPYEGTITAVTDTTHITASPVWPFDTYGGGIHFEIDPPGEPLVELYPRINGTYSALFWYYKKFPPLLNAWDKPEMPKEFHRIWIEGVREKLGFAPPGTLDALMSDLTSGDGLGRALGGQMGAYRCGTGAVQSALPDEYPFFNPLTGGH